MCKKQGTQIVEPEQLFLRHLLEAWTDPNTGHPTSQAFRPTRTEDEDCLSVDRAMSHTHPSDDGDCGLRIHRLLWFFIALAAAR